MRKRLDLMLKVDEDKAKEGKIEDKQDETHPGLIRKDN